MERSARRFLISYAAPALVLFTVAMGPLVTGTGTLYRRDVLEKHFPLKVAQAEALRRFEIPLVDPYRAGGQPLLGNPNVLALYPDNLFYLAAPPLWALNAHFWLHLLLAPWAVYRLGRAWGLGREAAWVAGVCYASSGFFLSQLNLFNLVAGAALAPAFAAVCLEAWRGSRARVTWAAIALLWTLLLLAGEPFFVLCAIVLGASAGIVRHRGPPVAPGRFAVALACGTALAAPQIVEFLRILPLSFRGGWGFAPEIVLKQSWDPRTVLEWWMPLVFGEPGFGFWGFRYYSGEAPLFYSLYPGLLALGLVLVSLGGGRRRPGVWAWIVIGAGAFVALGAWNPVVRWASELPVGSLWRFPVKAWLLVATGGALLCGLGFERLLDGGGRQRLERFLAGLGILYLAAWGILASGAFGDRLRRLDRRFESPDAFAAESLRWSFLCLYSLALVALLIMALRWMRRHPATGGAILIGLHAAGQLFVLRPLYHADDAAPYLEPPRILEHVPADGRVVHGAFEGLFRQREPATPPPAENDVSSYTRRQARELHPFAGILHGRRYELNPSPEGLDSFFTSYAVDVMRGMGDVERLRMLAASGVRTLVLDRELAPPARPLARLVDRSVREGWKTYVYRIHGAAEPARMITQAHYAPDPLAAVRRLVSPDFDPRTMAVLPGEAGAGADVWPAGRAAIARETAESIEVDVDAPGGGFLVLQRTYLEIYRAEIDGVPARVMPVDLHRLGLEVPAGARRVRVWADRGPTRLAWAVAGIGLFGLLALVGFGRGAKRR